MNMQLSMVQHNDVLQAWRSTAGTEAKADAIAVERALISKGAQVNCVEKPSHRGADAPTEKYLSVTYNNKTVQVYFADPLQETVHPPGGLILYNMLNRMTGPL